MNQSRTYPNTVLGGKERAILQVALKGRGQFFQLNRSGYKTSAIQLLPKEEL